jgi:multidrug efflux system membrane fusion protein
MNRQTETKARGKSRKRPAIAITIAVVAIVLIVIAVWLGNALPQTNDAHVTANTIKVVPQVSGQIVKLPVHDNETVKKGDLLFQIDPRPYKFTLEQAKAELNALDAQIKLTQRSVNAQKFGAQSATAAVSAARAKARQATDTLKRIEPLLKQGYASPQEVDQARAAQKGAQAQLQAAIQQSRQAASAVSGVESLVAKKAGAEAQVALAKLKLDYATVRAPFDGRVVGLNTQAGQSVSPNTPVFTLIATDKWYVVANFRETDLGQIHPGDPVTVHLMSDTGKRFKGVVDSIGYAVKSGDGSFLPGGPPFIRRTINWVHVSQRFPVRIRIKNPDPRLFRIGASAVVTVHPQHRAASSADP